MVLKQNERKPGSEPDQGILKREEPCGIQVTNHKEDIPIL